MKLSEDKVREVLRTFDFVKSFQIRPASIEIQFQKSTQVVYADRITTKFNGEIQSYDIDEYCNQEVWDYGWREAIRKLHSWLTSPSPTLEEQVRETLKPIERYISNLKVFPHRIEFNAGAAPYVITHDSITNSGETHTLSGYGKSSHRREFVECLPAVAALLPPPEPTIESLQKRVDELEGELEDMHSAAITGQGRINYLDDKVKELQDLLDKSVSEVDHEREMQKWEQSHETLIKQRDDARKLAEQFKQWFYREYAKNQPVLNLSEGGLHI